MRKVFVAALVVVTWSCSADQQQALQTEAPTTTALAAVTTTALEPTPWSSPAPVPGRGPAVAPAHRRVGDRDEYLLRFADGQAMILSLAEPWGDPAKLEAHPHVILKRPDGTTLGGQVQDQRSFPVAFCSQSCVELDQETRPDGGRNRRFLLQYPNREPSERVVIEFANWAMLAESSASARAFTLDTVDGFPVAHMQTEGYRLGPAKMFLCIRGCAVRMTIERMGAEACAARLKTERNDQLVSNSCIDDWHLYFDAAPDKATEVRAALTFRPAD